jgi:NADPH-dependent ferric siderophore reductase
MSELRKFGALAEAYDIDIYMHPSHTPGWGWDVAATPI